MLIRVLLVLLATTSVAFSQGYGKWGAEESRDEFTDNLNISLATQSKENISCGRSSSRAAPITLILGCQDDATVVIAVGEHCNFPTSNGARTPINTKYRVDKLPAKTSTFYGDGTFLGIAPGGQSISFIKDLIGHDKMIMQVFAKNKTSETATFSLNGLDEKIAKLRKACHW